MRNAFGLVEFLIATALVAVVGIPILTNVSTAVREVAASEEYMLAEVLARRYLAEAMAFPLSKLETGQEPVIAVGGIPAGDRERTESMPAYRTRMQGPDSYTGTVEMDELVPGLHRYRVTVAWPVSPGSRAMRRYELIRLRTASDLSTRIRFPDEPTRHARSLGGLSW